MGEKFSVAFLVSRGKYRWSYGEYRNRTFIDGGRDDDRFCYAASDIAINKLGYVTNMNGVGNTADWLGLIATFSTLGPSGLNLAISLSQQSNGYKSISDVTQAFNRMTKKNNDSRKYFTRIFKYCKDKLGEKWIHQVKMTYESNIFK